MRMSSRLRVSEGHVSCPVRNAQVDVEQCLSCGSFRGIRNGDMSVGSIVCKTEVQDALPSPGELLYGPLYRAGARR
jgi:hypothetical protein